MKLEIGDLVKFVDGLELYNEVNGTLLDIGGKFGVILENVSYSQKSNKRHKWWKIYIQDLEKEHIFQRIQFRKAVPNYYNEETKC